MSTERIHRGLPAAEFRFDFSSLIRDTVHIEVVYAELFERWLRRLRDQRAKARILTRVERIEEGNFGDHRSVGGGVSELRIHVGQGYRVYYVIRRRTVVILLCGGDKSSQQRDIARAQQLVGDLDNGS